MAVTFLFYKRLITLGGAEVLLGQHHAYLRSRGETVKVVCFEHADLERIRLPPEDLIVVPGRGVVSQVLALVRLIRTWRPARFVCHSGHIEFGLAACLAKVPYGVFLHQPTTMSFNETDKFAARYWPRYCSFARHDDMYDRIWAQRRDFSVLRRIYVNVRAIVSQTVLRRANVLFVLSPYAVREKREIFDLRATYLSGAITPDRVNALPLKSDVTKAKDPIKLVSVSRIDENKRIEILISAVSILRKRGRNVQLQLGGRGPATDDLKRLASDLGVADCIQFLGYVPEADIAALYEWMDLFVTIDWADYRITTYEVLAENRRVVVSDDTDIDPDLLESGYLFAAVAEANCLADTIEQALLTPVRWSRTELGKYLERFTWPVYFDKISQALEENHA